MSHKKEKYLNTPILYEQSFENIDSEEGIIKGIHITSEGEARTHGIRLDKTFIEDLIKLGNEQSAGVKSRFGHPNMSNTTLGTYIGRFKNFRSKNIIRKNGDKALTAIADLYLDEVAKKSPKGNLYEYVLELADSSPDMFGNSINFREGVPETKREKTGAKDEDGKDVYKEVIYARIQSLIASDLVDSPAATDKLFSDDNIAAQVTDYLDDNPHIYELLSNNPKVVENFLSNYNNYLNIKDMPKDKDNKDNKDTLESLKIDLTDSQAEVEELNADAISNKSIQDSLDAQLKVSKEKIKELGATIAERDQKLAENVGTSDEVVQAKAESLSKDKEIKTQKVQIESYKSQLEVVTVRLDETTSELNKVIATKGFKKGTDFGIDNEKTGYEKKMDDNANKI